MENTGQSAFVSHPVVPLGRDTRELPWEAKSPRLGVDLSIIVPTFNERGNIEELIKRLDRCLANYAWEVIFVDDDSGDGTSGVVRELAQSDRRVRCLQRIGRRGLSSACIEGMLSSSAPYLAVIDGDLQHDERLLARMLDILKGGQMDAVIGSRYVLGGGVGAWDRARVRISRRATSLGQLAVGADLKDPMSGFFMITHEAFDATVRHLSAIGFKLLLDIFASAPRPLRFVELPYQFRPRHAGESKLDSRAQWDYVMLLVDKMIGHLVPVRFFAFAVVGGVGFIVHLLVLASLFKALGTAFVPSQAIASFVAMTANFVLNNTLTYRDVRLRGWRWLRGWATFVLACSIGVVGNVGIAAYLFERQAGWPVAAIAGIFVGAVWNYATTATYAWSSSKRT